MKNHLMALGAVLAGVVVPGAPAARAYHCAPEPPCCPTVAHCWVQSYAVTGSGTYSPGLDATPRPQSMSFTGTATVVGPLGGGTYSCSWTGTDPAGSIAAGSGTLSGSCGPILFRGCSFTRVALAVEMVCVHNSDPGYEVAQASGEFTPVDTNPTTRYNLLLAGLVT